MSGSDLASSEEEPARAHGSEPPATGARASEPAATSPRGSEPAATGPRASEPAATGPSGRPHRTPAIELRELTRNFGERAALRDVTLSLPEKATLAVLGRNGAGKSTLLRILSTLLRPHGGTITVLGEPLPKRAWAVRAKLGYLGHDPLLYRDLTARENLTYHARLHKIAPSRVDDLLDAVDMRHRADDPVRLLSRGMVQRLAICRAVLHGPQILLLDEPRANLDPGAEALVEPLIGRAANVTRVLTSHDPQAALAETDLVLGLREGRQAFLTTPDALTGDSLKALYA